MKNKRLAIQISCSYEPNRLAEQCLSDAYEKVVSKEISQKNLKHKNGIQGGSNGNSMFICESFFGKQVEGNTIESQIAALEKQINLDGYRLLSEYKFIDNGYSGSHLVRPDLEKLRDKVTEGKIDKIYIHSPDRLSRKYAYQMVLIEEFEKAGAKVVFLNYEINGNPESQLLLLY